MSTRIVLLRYVHICLSCTHLISLCCICVMYRG